MQIRCATCTRTIAIAPTGELPARCPHCAGACLPERLGPYVPQRLLACGGMGEVYLARHAELGTEVALKLLPAMPIEAANSVRERFAREARLTAKVQHAGVVKVLASDTAGDRPFLVLEFVLGESLRQRLLRGPLSVAQAARIAALTADVLAAAHRQGVLHRDIKPDNVMLAPDGSVRVLDFGIARAMTDDAPLTRTGEILGTPEYMAPEQLLDGPEAVDERTDVHALGVLLYELLTQRSPFRGANLFQALKLVEALVPPPPSSLRADVPRELDAVVLQALQKQPQDRIATAAQFAAQIRRAVPAAVAASPSPRSSRLQSRSTTVLIAIAACALLYAFAWRNTGNGNDATSAANATANVAAASPSRRELAELDLAAGRWANALESAERALACGDDAARPIAEEAFVLIHAVWPLAAGLPNWVGACDEAQRRRLFGDELESPPSTDAIATARAMLARGEARAALDLLRSTPPGDAASHGHRHRLQLLAAHLTGASRAALQRLAERLALSDDPMTRVLTVRWQPAEQRAAAWHDVAVRLPMDDPEYWLAQRCGDAPGQRPGSASAHHAEMAWLHGAGELAILLDTALSLPPGSDLPPSRLLHRLDAADSRDSPAAVAMRALLVLAGGDEAAAARELDPLPPHAPSNLRDFTMWCTAARDPARTGLGLWLGLAASRVGALDRARRHFETAAGPAGHLCLWLLDRNANSAAFPHDLDAGAWSTAASLVREDATQIERLLACAADHRTAPLALRLPLLRLAVLAGADVDFARTPWLDFATGEARDTFAEEVDGGLR